MTLNESEPFKKHTKKVVYTTKGEGNYIYTYMGLFTFISGVQILDLRRERSPE